MKPACRLPLYALSLVATFVSANAAFATVSCTEGFDDVPLLPAQGWIILNRSDPLGTTTWFQGISARFPAQAGSSDSYASADSTAASGNFPVLSDWLITPDIAFASGSTLSFYTRELAGADDAPNRLEVLVCVDGGSQPCTDPGAESGDVGGFQTTLVVVNENEMAGGYPAMWTQYSATSAMGVPQSGSGRIAFHYYDLAQGAGVVGTTIGVDSVTIGQVATCAFTDVVFANGFD